MAGKLLNRARLDAKKYITRGGFEEDITLIAPNGGPTLETKGWATKHWINFESDGNPINSKNAHICIDETLLTEAGYPLRNSDQEVHLKNHRVAVKDSSGIVKNYIVNEWFPDETLGLIVCILGDYQV